MTRDGGFKEMRLHIWPDRTSSTRDVGDTLPISEKANVPDEEQMNGGRYRSKAELRKKNRRMKNGPGRNQSTGGRVDKCEGFSSKQF
ncbi:hypothetical protein Ccrd_014680 [Cynara cardunculus var. scolymus]|uniref:Uncharacterized protein n=1 Tax=Cynara cardunculus var. scolymus TaxID=59895 RepID=A0A118K458_CYNCS|nr:hypothetical protein Ccrd_014680 [Cynara cardunculus var. scolymus]